MAKRWLSFLFCLTLPLLPAHADDSSKLRIGYRVDAPPFSFLTPGREGNPTDPRSYSGFVVSICNHSLENIGFNLENIDVDPIRARDRFDLIRNSKIDIMCGPISITENRLSEFVFSSPVFLSGISFAVSPDSRALQNIGSSQKVVALLRNTTGLQGLQILQGAPAFERFRPQIFADSELLASGTFDERDLQVIELVDTYEQAFTGLCEGRFSYFVGDFDILSYFSRSFLEKSSCQTFVERRTLTRELYGIIFSREFIQRDDGFGANLFFDFQAELFSMYQTEAPDALFEAFFPGKVQSEELAAFFLSFRRKVSN